MKIDKARFLITTVFAAAWLAASAGATAAQGARVILKEWAEVLGSEVLLGDVAIVSGAKDDQTQELESLSFGPSPRPGYTRTIGRDMVLSRLSVQGKKPEGLRIEGAPVCKVSTRSVLVLGEEMVACAEAFLQEHFASLEGEHWFECPRPPAGILVPEGGQKPALQATWHGEPQTSGSAVVDITIRVDREPYTTLPLAVEIRRQGKILMAVRNIARGEPFNEINTALLECELTRFQGSPVIDPEIMSGRLARRNIESGAVVRVEDGYLPDLVAREDAVAVTVISGALKIRGRGVARQNGALGETVEVQNAESGRLFKAVVKGAKEVEVRL